MISHYIARLAKYLWILPAYLMWTGYPPCSESFNIFFAFAPLMWLSRRGDAKRSAKIWFLNGFLFWIATLSWMPAIIKNGGPWYLVVLGWFGLSAYCAMYFAAFGWLSSRTWKWVNDSESYLWRLFAILVAEPILFAGLEIVRSRLGGGFAWNHAGMPLVATGFGSPASIGGVYLLSILVILVNGTLAGIVERVLRTLNSNVPSWLHSIETFLPIAIVLGVFSFANIPNDSVNGDKVTVALMQRNFPCCFSREQRQNPVEVYKKLSTTVAPLKPDVVVLPESAMAEFGEVDSKNSIIFARHLMDYANTSAIVAGGSRRDSYGREYNSAGIYSRDGAEQYYDKVHLVPFGEYIPFDKTFTALQKLAPVGSCTPGELPTRANMLKISLERREVPVGLAICYEDTDSAQIRKLAREGAEMLFFITNDSWFSHSDEAAQHAFNSLARAIETGLPVARCGNSGVSGVIFPDGTSTFLRGDNGYVVDQMGAMVENVTVASRKATPYVRLGDKPIFIAFLLLIGGIFLINYKENYEKRRHMSL